MRILMVGWEAPPVLMYGGLGSYGFNLMKALVRLGHEVTWVGCVHAHWLRGVHRVGDKARVYGACLVTDLSEKNIADIFVDIAQTVNSIAPLHDLAIVHDFHVAPAVVAAKKHGLPVVYCCHAVAGTVHEVWAMMNSDVVVANSTLTKSFVEAVLAPVLSNVVPPPRKPPVEVVYPALPRHLPKPSKADVERELAGKKGFRVLVVSRNQPNKNISVAVEAIGILRKRGYDVHLVVVGRGWEKKSGDGVFFVGDADDRELALYYATSDAFVLPSVIEPFGLTALEAASFGLPVIVSENAGVKEVLRSALVFDPGDPKQLADAIRELIHSPTLRETVASRVREEATKRTWEDVAREILDIASQIYPYGFEDNGGDGHASQAEAQEAQEYQEDKGRRGGQEG